MITREQVADLDLQSGDVVEVTETCCGDEISHRGPLRKEQGRALVLGDVVVISEDGTPRRWFHSLTVVSRAPRPLYVNHPRTEPVPHDVVRDADDDKRRSVWLSSGLSTDGDQCWIDVNGDWCDRSDLPTRLRLLVDGETGQVVP